MARKHLRTLGAGILLIAMMMNPAVAEDFIVGGDVSSLRAVMDHGGVFYDSTESEGLLQILQEHGFNWIRLKIWNSPAEPYNDLPRVVQTAVEAKTRGLKFLLDFHYSDTWADPESQEKPAAWASLTYEELVDSVYAFTHDVIQTLKSNGATPDMVQIGNEIDAGMLFPDGSYSDWTKLAELLNAGCSAVRSFEDVGDTIKIMIHHSRGHSSFFRNCTNYGVDFDYIGRSYYPSWHGSLSDLQDNLDALSTEFHKGIFLAETAYLWTTGWNDDTTNVFWTDDVVDGYPASEDGQRNILLEIRKVVQNVSGDRGLGIFYWEPGWISAPTRGTPWENATLFDFDGNALSGIDALATDAENAPTSQVTLRINTSTLWDTLGTDGVVQLRGEVSGIAGNYLSDGSKIAWDESCELIAHNVGGDYWEMTFPMYVGDVLSYKYWTGFAIGSPTAQRVGYEGPVSSGSTNTRLFTAGENDTTLAVEFINGSGSTVDQFWRPYEVYDDSITIRYRVNMAHVMGTPTFLSGDSAGLGGTGPLSGQSKPKTLNNEQYSVADGSFWYRDITIPVSELNDGGFHQVYKFTVIRNTFVWFAESEWRYLDIPETFSSNDTTLHWVFYDDYSTTSSPEENREALPSTSSITATYPNPFNSDIIVSISLPEQMLTRVAVYNLLGQEVNLLNNSVLQAGNHSVVWNGLDSGGRQVATGVYLVRLKTPGHNDIWKITLVR